MNISELSDHEKSVMLARAMGMTAEWSHEAQYWQLWLEDEVMSIDAAGYNFDEDTAFEYLCQDFYEWHNEHLARCVIRWGIENCGPFKEKVAANAYNILRLETGIRDALDALCIEAELA